MTREDIYNGVRGTMFLYGGIFKKLIEKVGLDEAITIHGKLQESYGDDIAKLLQTKVGENRLTVKVFSEVYKSISNSGVENIYEVESDSFRVLGHQCPFYDGLKDAGFSHDLIMRMCTKAGEFIFNSLRNHYPIIDARIIFREKPDNYCIEWYKIREY
ncbi:hypothetical protein FJY84_02040 [Candidatus Bathyarchaeota archaeon]|nr:hypothetical protein [Candidatus Bathyarchaeota archaeon]